MLKYWLLFFVAIVSLSQASLLIRSAHAPIEVIGFWRMTAAGLILLLSSFFGCNQVQNIKWSDQKISFTLISSVFFFLHLWCYFYAAHHTKISNMMIMFSTNPLFTAMGAYLFFKEKMTWKLGVAYVFAFTGIWILASGSLQFQPEYFTGDILALVSGAFYSAYILTGKKARQHISTKLYGGINYSFVGFLFLATGLGKNLEWTHYPLTSWIAIAALVLIPTLMGHALFSFLLSHLNVNSMSCGKLIEPVIASVMAYLFFGENLSQQAIPAFFLTSTAVLILFFPWRKFQYGNR